MEIRGTVHKYGDHINTDAIIPGRLLHINDAAELGKHCMEDLDSDFLNRVKPGDVMVAGINFGCGSSREHAPVAIKAAGISCVIARSFARIFFRNAINVGLPILECSEAVEGTENGDTIAVELSTGVVLNATRGKTFQARTFPDFIVELVQAGGLLEYTRKKLSIER